MGYVRIGFETINGEMFKCLVNITPPVEREVNDADVMKYIEGHRFIKVENTTTSFIDTRNIVGFSYDLIK